jgi:hypothetical protein
VFFYRRIQTSDGKYKPGQEVGKMSNEYYRSIVAASVDPGLCAQAMLHEFGINVDAKISGDDYGEPPITVNPAFKAEMDREGMVGGAGVGEATGALDDQMSEDLFDEIAEREAAAAEVAKGGELPGEHPSGATPKTTQMGFGEVTAFPATVTQTPNPQEPAEDQPAKREIPEGEVRSGGAISREEMMGKMGKSSDDSDEFFSSIEKE